MVTATYKSLTLSVNNRTFAGAGIEPELLGATPRRVSETDGFVQKRVAIGNFVAGYLLVGYYLLQSGMDVRPGILCVICGCIMGGVWLVTELRVATHKRLLQNAFPVQATVSKADYDAAFLTPEIQYTYPGQDGKTAHGYLNVDSDTIKRVGNFAVGTTFTLLIDSVDRFETIPYFQITSVEIPGAKPVRTTPPVPETPLRL